MECININPIDIFVQKLPFSFIGPDKAYNPLSLSEGDPECDIYTKIVLSDNKNTFPALLTIARSDAMYECDLCIYLEDFSKRYFHASCDLHGMGVIPFYEYYL